MPQTEPENVVITLTPEQQRALGLVWHEVDIDTGIDLVEHAAHCPGYGPQPFSNAP